MLGPRPAVWRVCTAVAAAAIVAALAPAPARADSSPRIVAGPVIVGNPHVGAQLVASATVTGDPPPTATWAWLRCAHSSGPCSVIAGATTRTYEVVAADQGSVLRVRLRVTNPS